MSYSSSSGGTLTLPSPTHVHHVDVNAAVRSLRRSMSRSPSKFSLVRTASSASSSEGSSADLPRSPSQLAGRCPTTSQINTPTPESSSSFFQQTTTQTPFQPSVKLSVRSARPKSVAPRSLSRTRASPKSPLKRVFGFSPDSGNPAAPTSSPLEAWGQENNSLSDSTLTLSPASRRGLEKPSRHSMHLDISGASKHSLSKFLDIKLDTFPVASVSPLKRSDAIMNPDQTSFGSPVAKRRSLHGISSLGNDFNVFDHPPSPQPNNFDIHEDGSHEYQLTGSMTVGLRDSFPPPTPTAMPRRTSSLRKTTLQQRHGESRSSLGRRQGEKHLAQLSQEATSPISRNRPRLSLDQYLPPEPRGTPFSAQGALPNPSLHVVEGKPPQPAQPPQPHQPHPLSRSLTQSSSNSTLPDDSPTHVPTHLSGRPRVIMNFSKSLPVGARPPAREPVATPRYKSAVPFQAAFMSTGLVSKMNRNPERESPKTLMPDTPCKKHPYASNTFPPQVGSGRRQARPSFGSPSTPFSTFHQSRGSAFGNPEKIGSLFKPVRTGHSRRASLLSLDGDDALGNFDADLPPTPTKNILFRPLGTSSRVNATPNPPRTLPVPTSAIGLSLGSQAALSSCKSKSLISPGETSETWSAGQLSDAVKPLHMLASAPSPRLPPSFSSVSRGRPRRGAISTPSPLTVAVTVPLTGASKNGLANSSCLAPASPLEHAGTPGGSSPRTPQDSMGPPDAGRLSLSNPLDDQASAGEEMKSIRPPATPTTRGREALTAFGERRAITPVHGPGLSAVDEGLILRFDKAEAVGKGEFSQVFRVTKYSAPVLFAASFVTTPSRRTPQSEKTSEVYAVKKTRFPYHGPKDRESKLREVNVLKALSHCDHVVRYVNSWEYNCHLYIQTEYCDEGSLDGFLKKIGTTGRLDDFRIWKIMLELCRGLKNIHDNGFIHLDLKPANVFVTYEGNLKIGDFGMAARWPAEKGIEGEGDREYIGPEILLGQFDKPADIYSLGLIILEIACNVFLPENGPTWLALREGNMSVVPSLTWVGASTVVRDATGCPIGHGSGISSLLAEEDVGSHVTLSTSGRYRSFPMTHDASNLFGAPKRAELRQPPAFMVEAGDPNSLDSIVSSMIRPDPGSRPTAEQLLDLEALCWVASHRRAGATVFEGNWGPEQGQLDYGSPDTEMTDV
ncbi:mitosis inhibitor protein kinase [Phialemonium atrogriseum]|uniref:Mitosis inhibitor protein kinase n=1 Tax=Phialemonium atrogriseum TaxID=1093897 RepID=A0AAJ0C6L9_9PEZI|nr:mitosis inhibitor protein kinase [Phialemonium atrogriseum]KAK1770935.1 mitosis inhibitor protein kinase [Phialemonium atrogriseum]